MNIVYQIAFLAFIGACFRVATRISNKALVDILITTFIIFCGSIIITGFVLSEFGLTNTRRAWAVGVFVPAFVMYIQFTKLFGRERREQFTFFEIIGERIQFFVNWISNLNKFLKSTFFILLTTVVGLSIINFLLAAKTPPNEWDSMTGHLVRLLYYLQHGNMNHFGGTNWNIDTYPKSICTIQIYTYLMSGKDENFFKFIHFSSYLVSIVASFGIAQKIGNNFSASVFCALVIALLPNVLMQVISTDTDIVLCAYTSCLVYYLLKYKSTFKRRYLYLSGITIGIALGHKITFLLLVPSLCCIVLYAVLWDENWQKLLIPRLKHLILGTLIGVCLCTLPTGYLTNLKQFGHPIGPVSARQHQSIERAGDLKGLLKNGSRNVVRYLFDFGNLDGIRNLALGDSINRTLKSSLVSLTNHSSLRLEEETAFTILPFRFNKRYEFFNACPFYGIFGFALLLPLLFLVLVRAIKSEVHYFFAIAFILHLLALSFSAAYDPWKGRYFQSTAIFIIPFLTLLFTKKFNIESKGFSFLKTYILSVCVLGVISAIMVVCFNQRALPFSFQNQVSVFKKERIEMMTWARQDLTKAYQKFDSIVPQNAIVALADMNDDFEYPLFGKNLTRTLIPINPYEKGLQPIPKKAEYLFFAKSVIKPQFGDIRLGTDTTMTNVITKAEDYYLRKLNTR